MDDFFFQILIKHGKSKIYRVSATLIFPYISLYLALSLDFLGSSLYLMNLMKFLGSSLYLIKVTKLLTSHEPKLTHGICLPC